MIDVAPAPLAGGQGAIEKFFDLGTGIGAHGFDPRRSDPIAEFGQRKLLPGKGRIADHAAIVDQERNVSGIGRQIGGHVVAEGRFGDLAGLKLRIGTVRNRRIHIAALSFYDWAALSARVRLWTIRSAVTTARTPSEAVASAPTRPASPASSLKT